MKQNRVQQTFNPVQRSRFPVWILAWGLGGGWSQLACTSRYSGRTSSVENVQRAHDKLGFQYINLPDGLLVTKVLAQFGAKQAGLTEGDLIISVDNVRVDTDRALAIDHLQDPERDEVELLVKSSFEEGVHVLRVQRGITNPFVDEGGVSEFIKDIAQGNLNQAAARLSKERVSDDDVQRSIRLVLRNETPKEQKDWLDTIAMQSSLSVESQRLLMKGYRQLGEDEALISSWTRWQSAHKWDVLIEGEPYWTHSLRDLEQYVIEALGRLGREQEASALQESIATWTSISENQEEPQEILTLQKASFADVGGVDFYGKEWSVTQRDWTVLAFWATWCGPCKKEMPELDSWSVSHPAVSVVGINVDDTDNVQNIVQAMQKMGLNHIVGTHDPRLAARYQIDAIPTVILVDKFGVEHHRAIGYSPTTIAEIERVMDQSRNSGQAKQRLVTLSNLEGEFTHQPNLQAMVIRREERWTLEKGILLLNGEPARQQTTQTEQFCIREDLSSESGDSDELFWVEQNGLVLRRSTVDGYLQERDEKGFYTADSPIQSIQCTSSGVWVQQRDRVHWLDSSEGVRTWELDSVQSLQVLPLEEEPLMQSTEPLPTPRVRERSIVQLSGGDTFVLDAEQSEAIEISVWMQDVSSPLMNIGQGWVQSVSKRADVYWVHQVRSKDLNANPEQEAEHVLLAMSQEGTVLGTASFSHPIFIERSFDKRDPLLLKNLVDMSARSSEHTADDTVSTYTEISSSSIAQDGRALWVVIPYQGWIRLYFSSPPLIVQ